jgi:hypothetical protein
MNTRSHSLQISHHQPSCGKNVKGVRSESKQRWRTLVLPLTFLEQRLPLLIEVNEKNQTRLSDQVLAITVDSFRRNLFGGRQ